MTKEQKKRCIDSRLATNKRMMDQHKQRINHINERMGLAFLSSKSDTIRQILITNGTNQANIYLHKFSGS